MTVQAPEFDMTESLSGLSICIIGTNYAPEVTGNAPYTAAMAEALTMAGARVRVVTGVPHYPEWKVDPRYKRGLRWDEEVAGVKVTRLRHFVPRSPGLLGRGHFEASFLTQATPVLARDRSEVIIAITPMLSALVAAVFSRRRHVGALVQDLTGNGASQSGTVGNVTARKLGTYEYGLLRRCDRVGVITPRFADVLTANGVAASRIDLLPNFAHVCRFEGDRAAARRQLGWPEDRFLVVHTGNMGRKQGLETVIEAARSAESASLGVQFMLVGDGNQRARLQTMAAGLETVRFVSPVSGRDYPAVLAAADALLISERPGAGEMSMPSKITSYSSASRPIVAAVEPGGITHDFLATNRAAALTAAGSTTGLLELLTRIKSDASYATALAGRAFALYNTAFNRDGAMRRYASFASRLAGGIQL